MPSRELIDEALTAFRETRQLTFDLLRALSPEQLRHVFARPDLDTFGKHFQELGDTQECYSDAVRTGEIDFSGIANTFDHELVVSHRKIEEFLRAKDRKLDEALAGRGGDERVVWPGAERVSLVEHLSRLSRHETFHQGQFAIFLYELGAAFPKSWVETWAMPSRPGGLYRN